MSSAVRRIGYLNPYIGLAEDQAFQSLRAAAAHMDVELVSLLPSDLHESDEFDFVISTTAAVRKTTSHPVFLSAHAPRSHYVDTDQAFAATSTYDGYLCISDNLVRFFSDLAHARRLPLIEPGFYYNSPQRSALHADVQEAAGREQLRLCYFGTNWDARSSRLFQRLSDRPFMRIYGPEASWRHLPPGAYKGSVPFDGHSVQREYATYGVGLVCLSEDHLIDDIVSNRIFEISSVGACAICPDTAWMRDNFGDSVFYYDPFADPGTISARIDNLMAEITTDPAAAHCKGQEARRIFEARFQAGIMLKNAINYYQRWRGASSTQTAQASLAVDIIVRTGGRDLAYLERALGSIDAQTSGLFRIILVCYKPIDLPRILSKTYNRIVSFEVVEAPNANRSRSLVAGLEHIRSTYFALLDDDDYLLRDHFGRLLRAISTAEANRRFAYTDILAHDEGRALDPPWDNGRTILKEGPAWGDIHELMQRFSPHCFLATSDCLEQFSWRHWTSDTAEDVLLIGNLLAVAEPVHSPGATCIYSVGREETSNYMADPNRVRDELTLVTSLSQVQQRIESKFPSEPQQPRRLIFPVMRRLMEQARERAQGSNLGQSVLGQWRFATADPGVEDMGSLVDEASLVGIEVPLSPDRTRGNGVISRPEGTSLVAVGAHQPWELSLVIDLSDYDLPGCSAVVGICLNKITEAVAFGLIDERFDVVRKVVLPSSGKRIMAAIKNLNAVPLRAAALQAGAKVSVHDIVVEAVWLGYPLQELQTHFGDASMGVTEAQQALEAALSNEKLGPCPSADVHWQVQKVDIRSQQCIYRGSVDDGSMREGAVRTISTGAKPWDYFAQIHLPANQLGPSRYLRLVVSGAREALYVMVLDAAFNHVLSERISVRKGGNVEICFDTGAITTDAYLVFQASDPVQNSTFQLRTVEVLSGEG